MELSEALANGIERLLAAGRVEVHENGAWLASFEDFHYEVRKGQLPLLHLWSQDRNLVRRVLRIVEETPRLLTLEVKALGRTRYCQMEFVTPENSRRSRRAERERFLARFRDLLAQQFPDETPLALTTSADLKHSLSGNYARGLVADGSRAWAVLGSAPGEGSATCDALLTFGLLWLDRARQSAERRPICGLRLFFPHGNAQVTNYRLQALSPDTVVELYEYDEGTWRARRVDPRDTGNIETWLVPHRETESALAAAAADIERMKRLAPGAVEAHVVPGTREIALRFRGLLFARWTPEGMYFGLGDARQPLTPDREGKLFDLIGELKTYRSPTASSMQHALFRAQPERWLQSLVAADPTRVHARLDSRFLYAQVPALAAGDRGVLDLLGVTRSGRLAVIELKADEDPQLVIQGLDYWLRVRCHQAQQDFARYGYFPGVSLDPRPPLLFLVAPSIRFHPATEVILRSLQSDLEVHRVGISESWRRGLKVVLRQGRDRREQA